MENAIRDLLFAHFELIESTRDTYNLAIETVRNSEDPESIDSDEMAELMEHFDLDEQVSFNVGIGVGLAFWHAENGYIDIDIEDDVEDVDDDDDDDDMCPDCGSGFTLPIAIDVRQCAECGLEFQTERADD